METQLRNWFDAILKHAQQNYSKGGWDMFVECVGFSDFRRDHEAGEFTDHASALAFYKADLGIRNEVREDIQREAF